MELAKFGSAFRASRLRCQHPRRARQQRCVVASSQLDVPRKVAIFVEPSPFSHISGMKNRFEQLIKNLRDSDVNVLVFTPDPKPPVDFCGAKQELSKHHCRPCIIDVWQKGVDTDTFNPKFRSQEMRSEMTDGNPDAVVLLYVGRLGAEKNLKAIKEIMLKVPNSRLVFVGDGPERAELEQHFAGLPAKFMGMLSGERLSTAYASGDIFVMPSETETLGFVVMEAMASGLPVVAVAAGGLTDIIHNPGTTGFLYQPGDYQTAAQLTVQLAQDVARRQRVGAAAREEVLLWGWRAATQTLREQQYRRAVKVHSSKKRFRLIAVRMAWERAVRALVSAIQTMLGTLALALDYAREHRQPAGIPSAV